MDIEKLKKENEELKKYVEFLEENVSSVYCTITSGILSKINYFSKDVINIFEEKFIEKCIAKDDILMILKDEKISEEKLQEIKDYFDN